MNENSKKKVFQSFIIFFCFIYIVQCTVKSVEIFIYYYLTKSFMKLINKSILTRKYFVIFFFTFLFLNKDIPVCILLDIVYICIYTQVYLYIYWILCCKFYQHKTANFKITRGKPQEPNVDLRDLQSGYIDPSVRQFLVDFYMTHKYKLNN